MKTIDIFGKYIEGSCDEDSFYFTLSSPYELIFIVPFEYMTEELYRLVRSLSSDYKVEKKYRNIDAYAYFQGFFDKPGMERCKLLMNTLRKLEDFMSTRLFTYLGAVDYVSLVMDDCKRLVEG